MSTFKGTFYEEEFKQISVDYFSKFSSKLFFFLTHFHSDHTQGLKDPDFINYINSKEDVRIYCSKITKLLIHKQTKIEPDKVVEHEEGTMSILSDGEVIKVTALRAGHCPGSLMYLFESSKNNVLFTGDIRLSLKDLERCKPLKSIKLDSVYLDTTFASREHLKFPTREESFETISKIILESNKRKGDNEEIFFVFCAPAYIGLEFLMVKLYERFGKKIYIDEEHASKYTSCITQLANVITSNLDDTNFYFSFKRGTDNNIKEKCYNKTIVKIHPTALSWTNDKLAKGPAQKINEEWHVAYSSHSSLEELSEFVNYLKPKKIYPMTDKDDEKADEMIEAIYLTHAEKKRKLELPVTNFLPNKRNMSELLKKRWEEEQKIIKESGLDSP